MNKRRSRILKYVAIGAAAALVVLALLAALSIVLDIPGGKRFRRYCSYSDMKALMVGEKDDITATLDIWSRRSPVRQDRQRGG